MLALVLHILLRRFAAAAPDLCQPTTSTPSLALARGLLRDGEGAVAGAEHAPRAGCGARVAVWGELGEAGG